MAGREVVVFVSILAFLVAMAYAVSSRIVNPATLIIGLFAIALIAYVFPRIIEFKEFERGVIFRFGRYLRTDAPGWHIIFPVFESATTVDMRVRTVDTGMQQVTTADNITLNVDAISYVKITNPKKAVVEVKDLPGSLAKILETEIRSIVGRTTLRDLIEETATINSAMFIKLKRLEDDWGFQIIRAEIEKIVIPKDLIDAQTRRKAAEEYKQKLETEAQARKVALTTLDEAARDISDKTLTILYVDALKKIAQGKSNKIIFPLELTSLAQTLSGKLHKGKPGYDDALEALLAAYTEKRRELLDKSTKGGKNGA
ncbi:MAG: SPFH domain-containing protein [Candidatus Micrarchaeota archaeon]